MPSIRPAVLAAATALLVPSFSPSVEAQTWSAEQLEVWAFVQADWDASMQKDPGRAERNLHSSFQGWGNDIPAPRDREWTARWNRYADENTTTLIQQLTPLAIVVDGNTAVAHYLYSTATEDRKGDRETTHGRYTDVMVRDGTGWRFLAWAGGDDPGSGN